MAGRRRIFARHPTRRRKKKYTLNKKTSIVRLFCYAALFLFCLIRPPIDVSVGTDGHTGAAAEPIRGFDVSHYQGRIDWSTVARGPYRYVLIKATQGTRHIDPRLQENAAGAKQNNIAHGFYHFYDPSADPAAQAKHFIDTVRPFNAPFRPILDVEIAQKQSVSTIREGVSTWLREVEKAFGCEPTLYTYASFWDTHFRVGFDSYRFWLADYAPKPNPPKSRPRWLLWQYSQNGRVPGVPSLVDLDQLHPSNTLTELNCHD